MVAVFRSDESEWLRLVVLRAVAEARLPAAVPFLAEWLESGTRGSPRTLFNARAAK